MVLSDQRLANSSRTSASHAMGSSAIRPILMNSFSQSRFRTVASSASFPERGLLRGWAGSGGGRVLAPSRRGCVTLPRPDAALGRTP
eukprot:8496393-Heterocapsa_arctica.AAC.1